MTDHQNDEPLPDEVAGRPNVLLITSDQQVKVAMGAYGNPLIKTPNLDQLAADGILFNRAYTPHPTCTPARVSILSGQYGSRHGAYTIGTSARPDTLSVADSFHDAGYFTAALGKMHFQATANEDGLGIEGRVKMFDEDFFRSWDGPFYGFEHNRLIRGHSSAKNTAGHHYRLWLRDRGYVDEDLERYFCINEYPCSGMDTDTCRWDIPREDHPSVFVADMTIEAMEMARNDEKPFFAWASFPDPHPDFVVPEPYNTMYDPNEVPYLGYVDGEHDDMPPIYKMMYDGCRPGLPWNDEFSLPGHKSAKGVSDEQFRKNVACHFGMVTLMDEEIGRIIGWLKREGQYENTLVIFTTDHGDYLGNHGFFHKGFPSYEEVWNVPFVAKPAGNGPAGVRTDALLNTVDIAPTALAAVGLPIPELMQGVDQSALLRGETDAIRSRTMLENQSVHKGFFQKMLVTDTHKLVVYMNEPWGELFNLKADPNQYVNLWDSPEHQALKAELVMELLSEIMTCEAKGQPRVSYA